MINIKFNEDASETDKVNILMELIQTLCVNRDEIVSNYISHIKMNESHATSLAIAAVQNLDHADRVDSTVRRIKSEYESVSLKVKLGKGSVDSISNIFAFDEARIKELGIEITKVDSDDDQDN